MSSNFQEANREWTALEGAEVNSAYRLDRCVHADNRSSIFSGHALSAPEATLMVRLFAPESEEVAERQLARWRTLQTFDHPNLVRILDSGRPLIDETLLYLVEEQPEERLDSALVDRSLAPEEAIELVKSLVAGLSYLHTANYVHGAIGPEQIFSIGGAIKLSTDGARPFGEDDAVHVNFAKYLAPDDSSGNRLPQSDVWCLGATLAEAMTQRRFDGNWPLATSTPEPLRRIIRLATANTSSRCSLMEIRRWTAEGAQTIEPTTSASREGLPSSGPLGLTFDEEEKTNATNPLLRWGAIFAAAVLVIAVLWFIFRPKGQETRAKAVQTPLPASQQKEISPMRDRAEAAPTPQNGGGEVPVLPRLQRPSPSRRAIKNDSSNSAPAGDTGNLKNGTVWRLVAYTYNDERSARERAESLNHTNARLHAESIEARGNRSGWLVVVGGAMNRPDAMALRAKVRSLGLPRDSYVQNFDR